MTRDGDANVTDQEIDVGEGETEPGTVLFPRVSKRTISILWNDPETKTSPKSAIVRGESSLWRTAQGISIGTSLKQLERINGRPFTLLGFGWDYQGTVSSWEKGTLEQEFEGDGRVIMRLAPSAVGKDLDEVSGDRPFSSANPIMRRVDPAIYEIIFDFPKSRN